MCAERHDRRSAQYHRREAAPPLHLPKIDKDIIVAWCLEKDVHSPRALFVFECILVLASSVFGHPTDGDCSCCILSGARLSAALASSPLRSRLGGPTPSAAHHKEALVLGAPLRNHDRLEARLLAQ